MFELKRPCSDCPFRKSGSIRLTEGRAREVAGYFVNVDDVRPWTGATFPCHRTVQDVDENDDEGQRWALSEWQLCAGGVLFARKQGGTPSTIVQLAERLKMMDVDALQGSDEVVDTLDELVGLSYKRDQ